jgi:hypothetical protein
VRPTIPELLDKLATEGNAEQIAVFFEEQKIQGFRRKHTSCPVAQYLHRETQTLGARVGKTFVDWPTAQQYNDSDHCELPAPVQDFVNNFDGGCYPTLEAPSVESW